MSDASSSLWLLRSASSHAGVPVAAGYRTGLHQDLQEGCGLRLGGALKPSERELAENSRSRSAILWVLVKGRGVRVADVEAASYAEMGWGGTRRLRAMCFSNFGALTRVALWSQSRRR